MIHFPAKAKTKTRYMGGQWPACFTASDDEYERLVTDRVLLPLPCDTFIRVNGPDAASFLQGMVSQDVLAIAIGHAAQSWLLDASGRIEALIHLYRSDENTFLVSPPPGMTSSVYKRLDKYHIMEDLHLEIAENLATVTLQGPNHVGFHEQWHNDLAPLQLFPVDRSGYGGYDLVGARDAVENAATTLLDSHIAPAGFDAWHLARVEAFLPWFGIDMEPGVNPVIYGVKGTISERKGCYIGQETVAMTRDRGRPPRMLVWLQADGDSLPLPGETLYANDQPVGTLTSTVMSPKRQAPMAIGTIKYAHVDKANIHDETRQRWRVLKRADGT